MPQALSYLKQTVFLRQLVREKKQDIDDTGMGPLEEKIATGTGPAGKEAAFEQLFKSRYKALHAYAFTFVQDPDLAEDMVQAAFCKLWDKFGDLEIRTSLNAYLYRSVYHECLNHFKHLKVREAHATHTRHRHTGPLTSDPGGLEASELAEEIRRALASLPEGCRTVFQLSRFESLKYQEIADRLQLSVKTVENQMGKALKILRNRLAPYLPLLIIVLTLLYFTNPACMYPAVNL